jgi:hypothetical protein
MSTTETASTTENATACPYGTANPSWCRSYHGNHGVKRRKRTKQAPTPESSAPEAAIVEMADEFIHGLAQNAGPMSIWSAIDAKTAAMREEGERMLATRGETAIAEPRADQIRVLIARRDRADEAIAQLLREEKDERQDETAWLAWAKVEFGWGRSQAFARLSPVQIAKKRNRDADRQAAVRDSRTDTNPDQISDVTDVTAEPDRDQRSRLAAELIREGFRSLAKKHHPDHGGSGEYMALLTEARDWSLALVTEARA